VGDLRLSYSQFQELEIFSRFGTQLDENTEKVLIRGRRIREILKQNQYHPYSVLEQIIYLLAISHGLLDGIEESAVSEFKRLIREKKEDRLVGIEERINNNELLSPQDEDILIDYVKEIIQSMVQGQ
ncbi:MAG TPA: F0F1 ATP synthase subunit alpha, partial [Atribacterota bacterium]|nr:F0F1 ATP synthase subunit alpha [Atribacterota bacterium]